MEGLNLSEDARKARNSYYKKYRKAHPEKTKRAHLNYWEKKAREIFGSKYEPPANKNELSAQAAFLRRKYYADAEKTTPEKRKQYMRKYWENKAQQLEAVSNNIEFMTLETIKSTRKND